MKNLSNTLKTHMAQEVSTLATCWKITNADGNIIGFTTYDREIIFNGTSYSPANGMTPTAILSSVGLKVDNLEVSSLLGGSAVTKNDIEKGIYDFSKVEIFSVDYTNLAAGSIVLKTGSFGNIKYGRTVFTAEVRGVAQQYTNTITHKYIKTCRAELGDSKCRFDITTATSNGTLATIIDNYTITSDVVAIDGYYEFGLITWTSGANAGAITEVKSFINNEIRFYTKLSGALAIGDTFTISPGCNKEFATCKNKFSNVINFRGEPLVPTKKVV